MVRQDPLMDYQKKKKTNPAYFYLKKQLSKNHTPWKYEQDTKKKWYSCQESGTKMKQKERKTMREKDFRILYGISYNSHPQNSTKQFRRPRVVVKEQLGSFVYSFNIHIWSAYDFPEHCQDENMNFIVLCCKISHGKWHVQNHLPWVSQLEQCI